MDSIKRCGLQQPIHEPTHVLGHTLDVVISRDTSHIISDVAITESGLCDHIGKLTRDHFAVGSTTTLVKPTQMQKTVSYRKRAIDVPAFKHDTVVSSMLQTTKDNVDGLVTAFTNGLLSLLINMHLFVLESLQSVLIVHGTPINFMKLNISDGGWNDDGKRVA